MATYTNKSIPTSKCIKLPEQKALLDAYKARNVILGHVYNPSKFWIIVYVEQYYQWCLHLKQHYARTGATVPYHKLKEWMVYIVKINDEYYRAIHLPDRLARREIKVFLLDAGTFEVVPRNCIYFLEHQHWEHARFAVRARLHGVAPPNNEHFWSTNQASFLEHLLHENDFYAIILSVDYEETVANVGFYIKRGAMCFSVASMMINDGKATPIDDYLPKQRHESRYNCITAQPFLLPKFTTIEQGIFSYYIDPKISKELLPLHIVFRTSYQLKEEHSNYEPSTIYTKWLAKYEHFFNN